MALGQSDEEPESAEAVETPYVDLTNNYRIAQKVQGSLSAELYQYLTRKIGNRNDAADIVQDVFVRILSHKNPLKLEGYLRAFVYRTANNLVIDRLRHSRVRRLNSSISVEEADLRSNDPSQERLMQDKQELEIVEKALNRLSERHRRAVYLKSVEGLSNREISRKLNISIRTVERDLVDAVFLCQVSLEKAK